MNKREAGIELKKRGWRRVRSGYIPPNISGKPIRTRGPVDFRAACSFEAISYECTK